MKRVLIITYYWPPAGGIQVYRIIKFTKYLRDFGWEPIIFTARNPFYPYEDDFSLKDIPEGLTILKNKIREPFRILNKLSLKKNKSSNKQAVVISKSKENIKDKVANWIRANFFIPDARSLWINPSVQFLSNYIKNQKVDLIFTTAPPHSVTLIGMKLKEKTGIPWVSDWRDPWTQVDYFDKFLFTKKALKKHLKLEQKVFRWVDVITTVSPTWREDLLKIGAQNVEVIYSGFDKEDVKKNKKKSTGKFKILHAGTLSKDRLPSGFFNALGQLIEEQNLSSEIELVFLGEVDFTLVDIINSSALKQNTSFKGFLSKEKVLEEAKSANLMLVILNEAINMDGRIPGKIYESMALEKTTLCIGNEGSDMDKLLRSTGLGKCISDDNINKLKQFLYALYFEGENKGVNKDELTKYECKNQTGKLAEIFNKQVLSKLSDL